MIESILISTISKISAIMKYHSVQSEYMPHIIDEGVRKNALRIAIDLYVKTVIKGKYHGEIPDDLIEQNKRLVERIVKVIDVKSIGDVSTISFRFIDDTVLGQMGYERDMNKADMEYMLYSDLKSLPNSSILMQLVICFEDFFAKLFRYLISKYPDHYLKDRTLTFSEIVKMNHETIRSYLVENEVTNIMWEGFLEWVKRLEKHKLDFSFMKKYFDEYIEITCRRNLFVHNDGSVNQIYLSCVENSSAKHGDYLSIENEYIDHAFFIIQVLVYGISLEFTKIDNEKAKELIEFLINASFEHLKKEEWELSIFAHQRLLCNKYIQNIQKNVVMINLWIAKKNLYGLETIKKEIEDEDFSASLEKFQMAKQILLENYECAEEYLGTLFPKTITPNDIETWPLFIQYRGTEYYKTFREINKDAFEIMTVSERTELKIDENEKETIETISNDEHGSESAAS